MEHVQGKAISQGDCNDLSQMFSNLISICGGVERVAAVLLQLHWRLGKLAFCLTC